MEDHTIQHSSMSVQGGGGDRVGDRVGGLNSNSGRGVASPERSPELPAVEVGKGKGALCSWLSPGEGMRRGKFSALELEVSDEEA
jgi:hypothetical protein